MKKRRLSILLSLVMLLSLLPTTALAADSYPDPTAVSVDGGKRFSSSQLYYKNEDVTNSFSGTSPSDCNAHYDPDTGTLTLQGYDGGKIALEGAEQKDLTIKLIGENKITVNSVNGDMGIVAMSSPKSNITITADDGSNGKLTINVTSGRGDAVGIGNNIANSVKSGNVTIKGHADVTINAKALDKNKNSWGIYAGNVVIEENAKVAITVIAMQNTGGDLVYGIYANRDTYAYGDVTINTDGEITVDASQAGSGGSAYSIGVKSEGGNLFLRKVGRMTVKWVKNNDGTQGAPLSPAKGFDSSKYDNIVDKTTCTATYTPKVVPPTASVNNVTIDGTTGTAITDTDVIIKLANDTFKSALSGNWITNLPKGLTQSVSYTDDTHAKITVSGTPTVTSSADLAIKIPAANLVTSTSDLNVTGNTNARYRITAPATLTAAPTAKTGLVYNGTKQTGVSAGTGYTLGGIYEATDVGTANYTATATLNPGYNWNDGSNDVKTITWNIGRRTPTVADFTFTAPTDLTYDGTDKTASVTLKSPLTKSGAITPTYMKGSSVVTETKDVGTYTVKIDVAGGGNFNAGSNLTDPAWTFSITPANQNAPTSLGVAAPTASSGKGKISGTTDKMEYSTDSSFNSPAGTTCTDTATEVVPGTYYVRYKADANHNAGTAATVIVPAYTASGTSGGTSSGGSSGGGYVPKTQKPEIKAAAGGKTVLSKDGTTLTITADAGKVIDKVLLNGKDMGAATELKGLKTGDKVEVIFKDQVEGPTKEELDKAAKEEAGDLVLTARSAKLKNGSVKIMLKGDLKAITDAGYTVKYKFYRSTKKSAGYKAVLTKKAPTYVNTYGKQGTMYYYKAKVMIYDKEGNFVAQTALKQCKYANRLWTK